MMQYYFFKKKHFFFIFMLFCFAMRGQQNINQDYSNAINQAFSGLDKNRVPNGLLLDFAMDFTNVKAFNGQLTDSTNLDRKTYTDLYHTMLLSRVRNMTTGFMLPHIFANTWEAQRRNNNIYQLNTSQNIEDATPTIVLSGLYYEYSQIRDNALSQGDIAIQNNQYQDVFVNGQWQNPYESKKVFAMASPVNEITGSVVNFILPNEIWMSNNPSGVNKIEINADDGYGFRQINFNQQIGISYSSLKKEGLHNIIFKLTLNTGETLQSRIIIKFGDPQKQGLQNPPIGKQAEILNADRFHFIESEEAYDGKKASAILSINYASGREEIRRPLIISEGYDPGIITTPENVFGEGNIDKFLRSINLSDNNLRNLLTVDNTQEYDIIYVDWLNGVDDMRRNAKLLKTIIAWVNHEKSTNGSTEENVVIGQSMGGLIARHALREMEIENKDHETRLYVSHDSPHQGANVPYGLQYMARHARNEYVRAPLLMGTAEVLVPTVLTGAAWFSQIQLRDLVLGFDDAPPSSYPSPYAALTLADMPASRQLLRNFVKQDYTSDNTAQTNWQNELEAMGYPQEFGIRNVAISNGSECGTPQDFGPGDYLFRFYGKSSRGFFSGLLRIISDPLVGIAINNPDLFLTGILFGSSKYNYDIWAKTIPTGSNQQVYKGRIVYTKKLLFLIPIDVVLMNENLNAPSGSLPIDTYAGGFYNVKAQIGKDELPSFIGDRITHLENFNFIPVSSALDVGEGKVNLEANDYTASYSAGSPPSAPKNIPFDNFIAAFNTNASINPNQAHISFDERNANWLANELNEIPNNVIDCSFICNAFIINGSSALCSTSIYSVDVGTATTVNWSVSNTSAASLSSSTGSSVTVTATTGYRTNVILTANISSNGCGGNVTLTKSIWIGKPGVPSYLLGPSSVATGAVVDYQAGLSEGATSYEWRLPYPYTTVSIFNYSGQDWQLQAPGTSRYAKAFTGYAKTNGYVQVMGVNACGTGGAKLMYVTHSTGGGGSIASIDENSDGVDEVAISPNPASNRVTVRLSKLTEYEGEPPTRILGIKVLDQNSRERKFYQYNEHLREVEINVAFLTRGLNFLIIITDQGSFTKKLLIE